MVATAVSRMAEKHKKDEEVDDTDTEDSSVQDLLSDLISRAKVLLVELEQFRQHLRAIRQESHVETAHFRGTIQSELSMLEKLQSKPTSDTTGK